MRAPIEEPVVTMEPGPGGVENAITRHPAFAQIGASRVSGHTNLYDSDFDHNAFMTVTISRSQLRRNLANDWHSAREELIHVAMSEAQWATFVSSPNVGSGVPCTLQHIGREQVPGLPSPQARTDQFRGEVDAAMTKALAALQKLANELDGSGLPKGKAAALRELVSAAHGAIRGTVPFVAEQFDEHMEKTVERAKAEIHGYMTGALMRSGMDAIANGAPPLQLPGGPRDDGEAI